MKPLLLALFLIGCGDVATDPPKYADQFDESCWTCGGGPCPNSWVLADDEARYCEHPSGDLDECLADNPFAMAEWPEACR